MPKETPLTPEEDELWRAVMRIVIVLPRLLDRDMMRATGLTLNEYATLVNLSEAPNRELRMADLANAAGLSASRMTRLVEDLESRGLVAKRRSTTDGRGNVANITSQGLAKLRTSWPAHLASVRRRMFDHLDSTAVKRTARVLSKVAEQIDDKNR